MQNLSSQYEGVCNQDVQLEDCLELCGDLCCIFINQVHSTITYNTRHHGILLSLATIVSNNDVST
jgi:hypothetical protein